MNRKPIGIRLTQVQIAPTAATLTGSAVPHAPDAPSTGLKFPPMQAIAADARWVVPPAAKVSTAAADGRDGFAKLDVVCKRICRNGTGSDVNA